MKKVSSRPTNIKMYPDGIESTRDQRLTYTYENATATQATNISATADSFPAKAIKITQPGPFRILLSKQCTQGAAVPLIRRPSWSGCLRPDPKLTYTSIHHQRKLPPPHTTTLPTSQAKFYSITVSMAPDERYFKRLPQQFYVVDVKRQYRACLRTSFQRCCRTSIEPGIVFLLFVA